MDRRALLNSLIEKAAESPAPSRELFAEVWFATTGTQHPDIKGLVCRSEGYQDLDLTVTPNRRMRAVGLQAGASKKLERRFF
ncbi:hypothetical protein FV226_22025 [Methylobacterium sp. WL12]|uniref:hypothetical protein n=1 Tax=Methylobacterium sp. WL12 TaxID=2603890 RepID=UPI0011C72DCE|nr:hypothetical protein [Methylobacterium sp. WL12]TXM67405.1 hypothetical protein FV226_22025 [Methylobacterium sp. WL12]